MPTALACLLRANLSAGLMLFWLVCSVSVEGADSDWFYRSWHTDDGLPNNTVAALAQTDDGYLWLGTPSGLVRFDGIRFEDFSPTNFVTPPNRGPVVMLQGREALWLALDRGAVVRLDGAAAHSYAGLTNLIPNGLAEDNEGGIMGRLPGRIGLSHQTRESQLAGCSRRTACG